MLFLMLLACKEGTANVKSTDAAPFEVTGKAAVWATNPRNDGESGEALLVISDGDSDCSSLMQGSILNDLDEAEIDGSGLMFALLYGNDNRGGAEDFTGLWMAGYAYGDGGERQMVMVPFSDGFFYVNYGWYYGIGTTTWLRIDDVGSTISGEFATDYWSGSFSATDCGEWDAPERQERHDSW